METNKRIEFHAKAMEILDAKAYFENSKKHFTERSLKLKESTLALSYYVHRIEILNKCIERMNQRYERHLKTLNP